jgi:hypothetical protein
MTYNPNDFVNVIAAGFDSRITSAETKIYAAIGSTGVAAQVGDSIAAGYLASYGYITRLGYGPGITIANQYSQTGHTVAQIPADVPNGLTALYQAGKTGVMIFERGTNDIRVNGTSGAALYAMVAPYIKQYKNQGFYVAQTTLTPFTDGQDNATTRQALADYNALVRANSAGADAIIDFAADPTMGTYPTSPNDTTLYSDKLHPTTLGQDKLAAIAKPIVSGLLLQTPRAQGPILKTLTLSGSLVAGTSSSGSINNATSGSTITSNVSGLSVNSSARTYTWSGTGSTGTTAKALSEALDTSTTLTKDSPLAVTSGSGAAASFLGSALTMTNATYAADPNTAFGQTLTGGYGRTAGTFGTAGQNVPGVPAGFPFCIAVRFKAPTAAPSGAAIIASQGDRAAIGIGTDGRLVANVSPQTAGGNNFVNGGSYTGGSTNPVLLDGADHTVVLNVTATGATLFLDGTQIGTMTQTNNTVANTTPFGVRNHGASNPPAFFYTANISEVAVFNAEQAGTIMNSPLTYAAANIVELWHLDGSGAAASA